MLLRYFYNEPLAHASYMVGCQQTGEAIIVDPGRDISLYTNEARAQDMRIIAVTETHIHADYLSGARELAEHTGATLYLSDEGDEDWKYRFVDGYAHQLVADGASFMVGNIRFEVLHTPGHTPEHISLLVTDTEGADRPMGVFTGDFVFVGDVGRPDLLEEVVGEVGSAQVGARQMFASLRRFSDLPDYLQVWPAHGAGSACGKDLGAIPSSTVGYEKMFGWAFRHTDEQAFADELLDGQPAPPRYFKHMKRLNKQGPPLLSTVTAPEQLSAERLTALLDEGALVVDARYPDAFAAGHLPGTINIPYSNSFAGWAGWLVEYDTPFYLIAAADRVERIVADLAYIGLDKAAGYLEASALAIWPQPLQTYENKSSEQMSDAILKGEVTVIDVRNDDEWDAGHLPGAQHLMLGRLLERLAEVPTDKPCVVHCQSGLRSAIGASILQARGFRDVINLEDGWEGWRKAGLPVEKNGA